MCECITKVNELLVKERDSRLRTLTNLTTGKKKIMISTETLPGKKKQKFNLSPSYCPFCGDKYPEG